MKPASDIERQTSKVERSSDIASSRIWRVLSRILDFVLAAVFIYAGAIKALDPVQFAHDIDHFKILPWTVGVALAFYLPWLEIFCGLGLVFRFFYRGALSILTVLILVFTLSIIAAKLRGLDITCGCFGHASQHWSLPSHLATNLAILAALLVLSARVAFQNRPQKAV
ncbi:MAG TPA: MauE/DoxX family redox-associated membrane protein [Candidatus Udaeobacter sp.]|nr:MauE/DoxX family redox-associated membrane protein [Candidatus Udaeobacter sp.]